MTKCLGSNILIWEKQICSNVKLTYLISYIGNIVYNLGIIFLNHTLMPGY